MIKEVIIIGCGGHARSAADILLKMHPDIQIIFVDAKGKTNEKVLGFKVLKEKSVLYSEKVFIGIGDNQLRDQVAQKYAKDHYITLLSPLAHVGKDAKIAEGCFVGNFVHIGPEAIIGKHCILNNGCIIEHEVQIGDYTHIAPGVSISGRTKIGHHVFIGTGASVINNVSIADHVTIGAGSTVIKDITKPGTYVGSPARLIHEG